MALQALPEVLSQMQFPPALFQALPSSDLGELEYFLNSISLLQWVWIITEVFLVQMLVSVTVLGEPLAQPILQVGRELEDLWGPSQFWDQTMVRRL